MKVSEIQLSDIADYLRLEEGQYTEKELTMMLDAAKNFAQSQTGLDGEGIDKHEDITIAILVLIQDMFENRTMYVEKSNVNKVVDSILGMHRINFLPGVVT